MIILGIILGVVFLLLAFKAGIAVKNHRIVTLTDTYTPNHARSDVQQTQDDVMQLKNEIAASGTIKREYLGNGDVKLIIKIVK